MSTKSRRAAIRNQQFQTLSPLPSEPTRFIPSFQSPVPIEDEAVDAELIGPVERPGAVLVERAGLFRDGRQAVIVLLAGLEQGRFEERYDLVEDGVVSGHGDVMAGDVGEEDEVVGDPGPDALSAGRVPPVLDVPFDKLAGGRAEEMGAGFLRGSVDQGHRVLELVAEPEGAARLVGRRAAPEPAAQGLIEKPSVEDEVHRPIGRLDLDGAEDVIPAGLDLVEDAPESGGVAVDGEEPAGFLDLIGLAEDEE